MLMKLGDLFRLGIKLNERHLQYDISNAIGDDFTTRVIDIIKEISEYWGS